jgi:phosphatidylserine decarboxylase
LRLTEYGRSVILTVLIITVVLDVIAILVPVIYVKVFLLLLSVFLIAFTLYFFRDPVRRVPELSANQVLSPTDGRVMMISELEDAEYLNSPAKLVAVFLSPLDVHVNRIPVSGKVEYFKYVKGEYIMAFDHNSAERNERTIIGINTGKYRILFKQIAGFVARRIVCHIKQGDNVKFGEKFGMIKFGSRVDIILPADAAIRVSVDQKIKGGETIIAELT